MATGNFSADAIAKAQSLATGSGGGQASSGAYLGSGERDIERERQVKLQRDTEFFAREYLAHEYNVASITSAGLSRTMKEQAGRCPTVTHRHTPLHTVTHRHTSMKEQAFCPTKNHPSPPSHAVTRRYVPFPTVTHTEWRCTGAGDRSVKKCIVGSGCNVCNLCNGRCVARRRSASKTF